MPELVAGSGITLTPNVGAGTLVVSSSGGGGGGSDQSIDLNVEGFVFDATTPNLMADIEALINAAPGTRGVRVRWAGPLLVDRGPSTLSRPVEWIGYGQGDHNDAATDCPTAVIFQRGKGGFDFGNSQVGSSVRDMRIEFTGTAPTDGTATYSTGSPTSISSVSNPSQWSNGQTVLLEGAGQAIIVQGRTVAISSGSNVATVTITATAYDGSAASLGNPGVYVGQAITIAGAGAAGAEDPASVEVIVRPRG